MAYFAGKYFSSQYWQADTWNVGEVSPPIISEVGVRSAGSGGKRRRIPMIRLPDGRMYVAETLEQFNRLYAAIEHKTGEPPIVMAPPVERPKKPTPEIKPEAFARPQPMAVVMDEVYVPPVSWDKLDTLAAQMEQAAREFEDDDEYIILLAA